MALLTDGKCASIEFLCHCPGTMLAVPNFNPPPGDSLVNTVKPGHLTPPQIRPMQLQTGP